MTQHQQLSVEEMDSEWLSDPFLMDSNLDVSCLSPELRAKYFAKKNIKDPAQHKADPFDAVNDPFQARDTLKTDFASLLKDPEIQRELAERDPSQVKNWQDSVSEQVVAEFLRKTPDYLRTDKNYEAIIRFLATKFLNKNWLESEDAIRELVAHGSFTTENLGQAHQELLRRGQLDVPKGSVRNLSRKEQLAVLAVAQQHSLPEAVIRYVEIALGGFPDFDPFDRFNMDAEAIAWRAANAQILNFAVLWVWFNTKSGVSSEQFEEFRKSLSRYGLLTLELVDQ